MSKRVASAPIDAETFIAAVSSLIGIDTARTSRFGVAVSGGPDSLALLLLAAAAFPGQVMAATVDHGLRSESAAEAAHVAALCREITIDHQILAVAEPITGSIQASARTARYAALGDWQRANAIDWLMTGHHADDQLETMVMRLNRSSGVAGLAGIRERNGSVLRPFLAVRHDALVALVADHGWAPIDDPSNHDSRFDRVRMRQHLRGADWLNPIAAAASARALADAEAALIWSTERLISDRITFGADRAVIDITDVPRELIRRLICAALLHIEPHRAPPRGDAMGGAIQAVLSGQSAMLGDVQLCPLAATAGHIQLMKCAQRKKS